MNLAKYYEFSNNFGSEDNFNDKSLPDHWLDGGSCHLPGISLVLVSTSICHD